MSSSRSLRRIADVVQIAFPIALGILIALTAVNVPFWDEWEWADLIFRFHMGTLSFADLWAQHNEHRMLFPQLVFLGLDQFGGWSPVRELFISLALLICGQIGLTVMIDRTIHRGPAALATIFTTVVVYGLWQAENLIGAFRWRGFSATLRVSRSSRS
jgi:hypothetical protein